jgi:hypothetical protein
MHLNVFTLKGKANKHQKWNIKSKHPSSLLVAKFQKSQNEKWKFGLWNCFFCNQILTQRIMPNCFWPNTLVNEMGMWKFLPLNLDLKSPIYFFDQTNKKGCEEFYNGLKESWDLLFGETNEVDFVLHFTIRFGPKKHVDFFSKLMKMCWNLVAIRSRPQNQVKFYLDK